MSAMHTPGPWEAVGAARNGLAVRSSGRCIARLDWDIADEQDEANAHLIAAAPDMFAALEAYEARIGDRDMGSEYLTSLVLAALAKARGEA